MNVRALVLGLVLAGFGVFSTYVTLTIGFIDIFAVGWTSLPGAQVFGDLTLALTMVSAWMWRDARKNDMSPWPWLIGVPFLGSISPLTYLLVRELKGAR